MQYSVFITMASFLMQTLVAFFITPFILHSVGDFYYGLVMFAIALISYFAMITSSLSSVFSRFMSYSYHLNDTNMTNAYFSSTWIVFIVFSSIVLVVCAVLFWFFDYGFDLKIKFVIWLYFLNYSITLMVFLYSSWAFIFNRVYWLSMRNAASFCIYAICIVFSFLAFYPDVIFVAFSAVISSIFSLSFSFYFHMRLLKINFSFKKIDFSVLTRLLKYGKFSCMIALSRNLLVNSDIIIVMYFLGATQAGLLGISKQIPLLFESLILSLASNFLPKLIKLVAKNKFVFIKIVCKKYTFMISLVLLPLVALAIVIGNDFFRLWLNFKPKEQVDQIYNLFIFYMLPFAIFCITSVLVLVDSAINNLKRSAVFGLIFGLIVLCFEIFVITNGFGLEGLILVFCVFYSLRCLIFDPINAALNLKLPIFAFFGLVLRCIFIFVVLLIFAYVFKYFFKSINSWSDVVIFCIIFLCFSYLLICKIFLPFRCIRIRF